MIDVLSADTWRAAAAVISVAVLFLLAVGLAVHSDRLQREWRVVLWAVVLEQAVIAYLNVDRANDPRFPDGRVDEPLIGIVASLSILLLAVLGVFVAERRERRLRGVVC